VGGTLKLNLPGPRAAEWFDPRTGECQPATDFTAPDEQDWVLVLSV